MKWSKLGKIFNAGNLNSYLLSHASNPLPVHLYGDVFRIFYSGRNIDNKSSVSYVDIDILTQENFNYPSQPIFIFGEDDSFYSHGISIGNCYSQKNEKFILFMGWQIRDLKHWIGEIGRLEIVHSKELYLNPSHPYMKLDKEDPISLSYPYVLSHDGFYKMWYGSTLNWSSENGEMIHVIKYATSKDGERWNKHGLAIPFEIGVAQAFSKPSIKARGICFTMETIMVKQALDLLN